MEPVITPRDRAVTQKLAGRAGPWPATTLPHT
jgi:hypothetical protein